MNNSNFSLQIKNVDDFSYPYNYENSQYAKVPFQDRPGSNPSGGINSSASEMVNMLPNERLSGRQYSEFLTTIDEIEAATGLNFLSSLPAAVQDTVESRRATEIW